MAAQDHRDDVPHWREYPVSARAELSMSVAAVLVPFLIGILALFGVILTLGLLGEDTALLSGLAVDIDQFARFSMSSMIGFAWLAGLATLIAFFHRDIAISRAVDGAAVARAPRTAVPSPAQVERVTTTPGGYLVAFAYWNAGFLGLGLVVSLSVAAGDPVPGSFALVVVALLIAVSASVAAIVIVRKLRPAHEERRKRIAAWWTTADEQAAWDRATSAAGSARNVSTAGRPIRRAPLTRLGAALSLIGTASVVASGGIVYIVLIVTHPDAQRGPGGQLGPRARLSDEAEANVDVALVVGFTLMAAGVVALLAGTIVDGLGHAREKSDLRRALADPSSARPTDKLIQRYVGRAAPHLSQALAALAGACLCLGTTGLALGRIAVDAGGRYREAAGIYADLAPQFVILMVVGAVLLVVAFTTTVLAHRRGVELRNELLYRWPLPPRVSTDPENKPPRARVGPALSAGME